MAKLKRDGDNPAFWREVKVSAATQGLSPPDLLHSIPVFN